MPDAPAIAVEMSVDDAQAKTAKIKSYLGVAWELLLEIHERKGYKALGYATFEEYLRVELDVSRSRGYQLLDQGRVVRSIAAAAGVVSTSVDITEAAAREIKPVLSSVTSEVGGRVAAGEDPAVVIPEVIDSVRHQDDHLLERIGSGEATTDEVAELAAGMFATPPGARSAKWEKASRSINSTQGRRRAAEGPRPPLPPQILSVVGAIDKAVRGLERLARDDRFDKHFSEVQADRLRAFARSIDAVASRRPGDPHA